MIISASEAAHMVESIRRDISDLLENKLTPTVRSLLATIRRKLPGHEVYLVMDEEAGDEDTVCCVYVRIKPTNGPMLSFDDAELARGVDHFDESHPARAFVQAVPELVTLCDIIHTVRSTLEVGWEIDYEAMNA